jgi:hypothetical protein
MLYKGHGFFTEDIHLVRPHLEDFGRADFRALAATIALVRVDDDIPIAGAVFKTIVGYHVLPFFLLTLSLSPQRPCHNRQETAADAGTEQAVG